MAAILHDTVEDTGTTPEELEAAFGAEVRDLVLELTDDKSLPKEERKRLQVEHAPHSSARAKLVKLGDKIANVCDVAATPPAGWRSSPPLTPSSRPSPAPRADAPSAGGRTMTWR
jgi:guanosine-3',5'-bis(diphosphate) 3'-pyrophosphohydrolase